MSQLGYKKVLCTILHVGGADLKWPVLGHTARGEAGTSAASCYNKRPVLMEAGEATSVF